MSDATEFDPTAYDENKPTQAEGDDPERPDTEIVLEEVGRPSSAEGEDPDDPEEVHVVLDPVDPA
jgi:hypothetical protein